MECMKRNVTFYLLMCLLAACTGRADREAQADYVFDADVAVTLPQSGLMLSFFRFYIGESGVVFGDG